MKIARIIALVLAGAGVAVSVSCNTTRGFGQDLQKVGEKMEERAERTGGTGY